MDKGNKNHQLQYPGAAESCEGQRPGGDGNLLTDGTVPPIDMNDSRENIRAQSAYNISLLETGISLMPRAGIAIKSAVTDLYKKFVDINLGNGGNGGAFYNHIQQIFGAVKDFINSQIQQQVSPYYEK